jgi:hypothetical protein
LDNVKTKTGNIIQNKTEELRNNANNITGGNTKAVGKIMEESANSTNEARSLGK